MRNIVIALLVVLAGCSFAPRYTRPRIETPSGFKELAETNVWKIAEPREATLRGKWWELFGEPELNALEEQVSVSNQTVAAAFARFLAARAVIKQARSEFFPTVTANPSVVRSRQSSQRGGSFATNAVITLTEYTLPLDASWELDFWGRIRNSTRASAAETQATLADLENTRLTVQAELAADYFQLRAVDMQKQLLDAAVHAYQESLSLTQVRHQTGIASDQDVAQAETQLKTTQAQATDLGIQRALLEHAIALLVGKPASAFAIPTKPLESKPAAIPFGVPSQLVERRPDIAAAERRVAEANAQIGVARAAYFPTITLSGSGGYQSTSAANLFSGPTLMWSVGAALAQTIFDAGKRRAVTEQAWASYRGVVANYRQTVLGAFQEVEDNLAALLILSQELQEQDAAVAASERYLALANDRYKLGIDSYLNVITAQTTLLNNQRTAVTLRAEQMTASVQLIKALGGGWDSSEFRPAKTSRRKSDRARSL
jgi:NodT family efflux transporter outer membrane factor (OMF) lipoprotein